MRQIFSIIFLMLFGLPQLKGQNWVAATLYPSPNGTVTCTAVLNNELYVGGTFSQIGGIVASRVAKWTGSNWVALGTGATAQVNCMIVYNNSIFIGSTTSYQSLKKWNGTAWIPGGLNGNVTSMCIYNGQLVVAGSLSDSLGNMISVAIGNGASAWTQIGTNATTTVNGVCVYNSEIYATGYGNGVGKWNGTNWVDVAGVTASTPTVLCLNVFNNKLIAGGSINSIGGITTYDIVQYDGTQWSNLGFNNGIGGQSPGITNSIYVNGSNMFLATNMGFWTGSIWQKVVKWNGSQWTGIGQNYLQSFGGTTTGIYSLIEYNNDLFAGGDLTEFGNFSYLCKLGGYFSGIAEFEETKIKIFPNPASDFLHIENPDSDLVEFFVFDYLGKKMIHSYKIENSKVDLKNLSRGLYLIQMRFKDGNVFHSSFIIE